jgi:uncharacterized protein (DUF1810 family)
MWFVFPQLAGLGRSTTAQQYAISGLDEARAYLSHPVLGARLRKCATVLAELPTTDAAEVFGALDAPKLRSCMTLFARADPDERPFTSVLERFFGGTADDATLRLLGSGG